MLRPVPVDILLHTKLAQGLLRTQKHNCRPPPPNYFQVTPGSLQQALDRVCLGIVCSECLSMGETWILSSTPGVARLLKAFHYLGTLLEGVHSTISLLNRFMR